MYDGASYILHRVPLSEYGLAKAGIFSIMAPSNI